MDGIFLYLAQGFHYQIDISHLRVFLFAVHSQGILASVDESGVEGQGLSLGRGVVERQPAVLGEDKQSCRKQKSMRNIPFL